MLYSRIQFLFMVAFRMSYVIAITFVFTKSLCSRSHTPLRILLPLTEIPLPSTIAPILSPGATITRYIP